MRCLLLLRENTVYNIAFFKAAHLLEVEILNNNFIG